jgi:uncharacterized protein DUF6894
MRCHFDLVDAHQTLIDEQGVEVADVDEARTLARDAIREAIQEGALTTADCPGWRLEARDASGAVLFAIRLDALPG